MAASETKKDELLPPHAAVHKEIRNIPVALDRARAVDLRQGYFQRARTTHPYPVGGGVSLSWFARLLGKAEEAKKIRVDALYGLLVASGVWRPRCAQTFALHHHSDPGSAFSLSHARGRAPGAGTTGSARPRPLFFLCAESGAICVILSPGLRP